ncbi:hypothetical protein GCM10009827_041780 [Dactylosporangium maewongense]|uniref:Uncharacterized protein n=1 Tax=Dactylosporangium maewongense TaxID=634393 RepID=A0ABP4LDH8_9ACTN
MAGPVAVVRPDVLLIGRPAMAIAVRTLGALEWFAILAGSSGHWALTPPRAVAALLSCRRTAAVAALLPSGRVVVAASRPLGRAVAVSLLPCGWVAAEALRPRGRTVLEAALLPCGLTVLAAVRQAAGEVGHPGAAPCSRFWAVRSPARDGLPGRESERWAVLVAVRRSPATATQ